jgi:hypothetical protein
MYIRKALTNFSPCLAFVTYDFGAQMKSLWEVVHIMDFLFLSRHVLVVSLLVMANFHGCLYLKDIFFFLFFLYFFGKHNMKLNLTTYWHPQVKLIGRGPAGVSSLHHWVWTRTFCCPGVPKGAIPMSHHPLERTFKKIKI